MTNKKSIISYALAAIAGLCLVQGLVILSDEGRHYDESNRGNITDARQFIRYEEKTTHRWGYSVKHISFIWWFSIHRHNIKNGGEQ